MKLPAPSPRYETTRENERNRLLEQADARNHKKNADIEVGVARLILTAPDGTRWSIVVDNSGVVTGEAA